MIHEIIPRETLEIGDTQLSTLRADEIITIFEARFEYAEETHSFVSVTSNRIGASDITEVENDEVSFDQNIRYLDTHIFSGEIMKWPA